MNNNLEDIKNIITKRKNSDTKTKNGYTPLILAILMKKVSIVSLLLELNVDIELTDKDGKTALFIAIENDYVDVVKLLVEHKANILTYDKNKLMAINSKDMKAQNISKA